MKRYGLGILFLGLVSLCLLPSSFWFRTWTEPLALAAVLSGAVLLSVSAFCAMRLAQGKIVSAATQCVCVAGGELELRTPPDQFEVWFFSETPFARYFGEISILGINGQTVHTIRLPRRRVWITGMHNDLSPLVWRSLKLEYKASEWIVRFGLRPCFHSELMQTLFPTHESECITAVVKCRGDRSS